MSTLLVVLALTLLGGFGGLIIAAGILLLNDSTRTTLVPWLVSYAVGAMLGVSLLEILPASLETLPAVRVFATLLGGILTFFILEKLVLWRHSHSHDIDRDLHESSAALVLVGDSFHNFVDGALIAAAVMTSIPLGVSAAVAVAAHEIPQEIGDFAVLLHAGYSRRKALALNILSALASVGGALLAYLALDVVPHLLPHSLVIAASSFLYVAMSDLIPGLHRGRPDASSFRQIILVGLGIATVLAL